MSTDTDTYILDIKAAAASGALTTDDAVSLISMVQAAQASNKISASLSKQARQWQTARADKIMAEQAAVAAVKAERVETTLGFFRDAMTAGLRIHTGGGYWIDEMGLHDPQGRISAMWSDRSEGAGRCSWAEVGPAGVFNINVTANVDGIKETAQKLGAELSARIKARTAKPEVVTDLAAHWTAVCAETPAASDSERHAIESLSEAGISNPSTALLRARLMLGHTKEARDLAHGWPGMLGVHGQTDLISSLDRAETIAVAAYRHLLTKERLSA